MVNGGRVSAKRSWCDKTEGGTGRKLYKFLIKTPQPLLLTTVLLPPK
jgi:hypothetical protein